jgi:hypothetical protein
MTQCIPKSTDKDPANANPIKATDCGVFKMIDPFSLRIDMINIGIAKINSIRYTASGPNRTGGVR